ncbi:MAG TPA: hypothetical protein VKB68_12250 [Stellaceae bacterium]|nr:hypothetical protein [Stellaceae bacterium]
MTNYVRVSMPNALRYRMVVPLLLALLALLAFASRGSAQEQGWTKVDCAGSDAHLTPPSGVHADCYVGPFQQSMGQVYACRLSRYSFGVPAEAKEPHFYARASYPKREGKKCSVILEPADSLQHVHKFVELEATNWSPTQTVGDIQLMFFDAKNQKREGKCASFTKLGPAAGRAGQGYLFKIVGFLCKGPGQPLDAAAAAALVNGIRINVED